MKTIFFQLQVMPIRSLTNLFFILLSTLITAVSCKKPNAKNESASSIVNTIADQAFGAIVASDHFTWNASKLITLNIQALSADIFQKNVLIVKTENNEVVLVQTIGINETLQQQISIPATASVLHISYGTINKLIAIQNDVATINFETPIPVQYQ